VIYDEAQQIAALGTKGEPYDIAFPEPVYAVGLDANPEYETNSIRLHYTSLVTPESVYEYDLDTQERVLRKQKPVLGGAENSHGHP
jgi:oligopeptidase B